MSDRPDGEQWWGGESLVDTDRRADDVLAGARARYGDGFSALLPACRVWVNGEPAHGDDPVGEGDEVAVLPPVSGGAA